MGMGRVAILLAALAYAMSASGQGAYSVPVVGAPEGTPLRPCPHLDDQVVPVTRDYRDRDSSAELKKQYYDQWKWHTEAATRRLRAGEFTIQVLDDLHFTLMRWPNHLIALQGLVQYDLADGPRDPRFLSTECYFDRSRYAFANDAEVASLRAYWLWKKGKHTQAEQAFAEALKLAPDSAEVNYNAGLFYASNRKWDKATACAEVAYAGGYPLPGLKNILEKAGHPIAIQTRK